MKKTDNKMQLYFFLGLFGIVTLLLIGVLFPFISVLAIAAALAVVFNPIFKWFKARLFNSDFAGALATVIFVLLVVFVPLSILGASVFNEASNVYDSFSKVDYTMLDNAEDFLSKFVPNVDLRASLQEALSGFTGSIGSIFSFTAQAILYFSLGVIALYYFLKEGDKFLDILLRLSPLGVDHDNKILSKMGKAINSIFRGSLIVAIVQAILTGVGFWIFGVPNPALWGSITVIIALVPIVGTGLITIPGVIYLLLFGSPIAAIGLLAWGILSVGLADDFIRPILIGRGVDIHPYLIILSVLGGISFFGIAGFLLGPLILSLFFALSELYDPIVSNQTVKK